MGNGVRLFSGVEDANFQGNIDNRGVIKDQVILSDRDDRFDGSRNRDGVEVTGGLSNDDIRGRSGIDTVRYNDEDPPVRVNLANGAASRKIGVTVTVEKAPCPRGRHCNLRLIWSKKQSTATSTTTFTPTSLTVVGIVAS